MEKAVYVIGHKNPDTDSICSAVAYAELKRKLGTQAVAGRLGEINPETAFVLDYFNQEIPELVTTVKKQVSDLDMDQVPSLSPEISLRTTWNLMKKYNRKSLPVVDDQGRLLGIVTLSDLTEKYMAAVEHNAVALNRTPLHTIAETLNATIVCGSQENFTAAGKVLVLASEANQLDEYVEKDDIVISGNRPESIIRAMELGAKCVIVTLCHQIDPALLETAARHSCILMITPADTFSTAIAINLSIPCGSVMTSRDLVLFDPDDFVDDVRQSMMSTRFRSYPVVDDQGQVLGLISRYHVISQNRKQVILVDHNEISQTVPGIEEAEILEIIDHHRLGDIQTDKPLVIKSEPVGCTATIIANLYFDSGIRPAPKMAGLMCAAILSDTLKFQSPTSTYLDKTTAERLAEIAALEMETFALQMFRAGSNLKGQSPRELLRKDFKELNTSRSRIGIGQVYTVDLSGIEEIRQELMEFMETFSRDSGFDLLLLMVTDIQRQGSEMLFTGEKKDIVARAFGLETQENSVYLPGVVSRKKQVIPNIVNSLNQS